MHRFLGKYTKSIDNLRLKTIPIMSNYLFIPTVVIMMCIITCDKAINNNLTGSFLNYDCNQTCWIGNHIQKVVPALLFLVIYVPVAILYRTLWQENDHELNIRANSTYLIGKTFLYIVLVIFDKTIKTSYAFPHALAFTVIMIALMLYVRFRPPFNYDRANLWGEIILCCVVWNSIISTISMNVYTHTYTWIILQLTGWVIIVIIGVFMQSRLPPNLIITKKGKSIVGLFRFEFGFRKFDATAYCKENKTSIKNEEEQKESIKNEEENKNSMENGEENKNSMKSGEENKNE